MDPILIDRVGVLVVACSSVALKYIVVAVRRGNIPRMCMYSN
jgi:hypothetical protein